MKIDVILKGKPFQTEFGIVGYSTVVLIRTADRNILYDTGLKGCALQLKEGLKEKGLSCEDITDVVISHLHFDHVGNIPLFSNANFYISMTEWTNAVKLPDEWDCIATCEFLRGRNLNFVAEGDILFEKIKVLELPGHTLGLIGLQCEDAILCSDAIKNRYELWQEIPLMTMDEKKSRETVARIKENANVIYPGHDEPLYMNHPIDKEPVSFDIRFANGNVLHVNS